MQLIVDLLKPFQEATENLSGEHYVTISFFIPFLACLKTLLEVDSKDNQMIK